MLVVDVIIGMGLFLTILGGIITLLNIKQKQAQKCPGCKNAIQLNTKSCPYCGYILH